MTSNFLTGCFKSSVINFQMAQNKIACIFNSHCCVVCYCVIILRSHDSNVCIHVHSLPSSVLDHQYFLVLPLMEVSQIKSSFRSNN